MSYNGNGVFLINTAGQPVVPNTVISSTTFNLLTADLANGLTNAITKDGQSTVTSNIPMSNFKITGLGAGTSPNDAVRLAQIQDGIINGRFVNLEYTGTFTGGTGVVNLGSGQFYKDASGNVGFGTTVPASRFAVVDPVGSATSISFLGSPDNQAGNWRHQLDNVSFSGRLRLRNSSNVETIRLDSAGSNYINGGNLGVGISSPTARLHVVADVALTPILSTNPGNTQFGVVFQGRTTGNSNDPVISLENYNSGSPVRYGLAVTSSGALTFKSGAYESAFGNERMRIDSLGNLGIGTSTASSKLSVNQTSTTLYAVLSNTPTVGLTAGDYVNMAYFANGRGPSNDGLRIINVRDTTGSGIGNWETESYRIRRSIDNNDLSTGVQAEIVFGTSLLAFNTGGSERMRISTSGDVSIKTTSAIGRFNVQSDDAATAIVSGNVSGTAAYNGALFYNNGFTSLVGQISISGSTASYLSVSDYRLKDNVAPMTGALATVAQLKPVTYKWKADGSAGQGFIAHELQAVVPDCVTGAKDAIETVDDLDAEGRKIGTKEVPRYQGVDTSFLVATLVAAIQELKTEVDALKAG